LRNRLSQPPLSRFCFRAPGALRKEFAVPTIVFVLAAVIVLGLIVLTSTVKIVQEYERGVIFRLGRLVGARGPGLFLLIPGAERMRKVDLRIVTLEVPAQEAITRDNVTVKVNAVVYFRVVDPEEADSRTSTISCPSGTKSTPSFSR
jgi:regulator of protease activity HflC (stomatin/prohibitin superfamily)